MNNIHILPKSLNYLDTLTNTKKVHQLFDLGANEDVLRALFIENSAEFDVLESEEIFQIYNAILRSYNDKLKITSTGLRLKNNNSGIVSIRYALDGDLNATLSNHSNYVSGLIELETKLDHHTKFIDFSKVVSHHCELNVFYEDEAKHLPHEELSVFKNNQFYSNAYFNGERMHKTIMHQLELAIDELRNHIYT